MLGIYKLKDYVRTKTVIYIRLNNKERYATLTQLSVICNISLFNLINLLIFNGIYITSIS